MTYSDAQTTRWAPLRDAQREAVVASILKLISEGQSLVTVAEISESANMSRPTFYKYFPTLGAAMLHTHREVLHRINDHVDRRAQADGPALDRMLSRFEEAFEYTCTYPELMRFFSYFDFTFRRFGLTAEERNELVEITNESGQTFVDLFHEGQLDGSISPVLPKEQTIMAIAGSVSGLEQRLLIQEEYSSGVDDRARAAHSLLLDSWRTKLHP
jgi:AcrR family transcriptional regulator